MNQELENKIKVKIAITLRRLLFKSKDFKRVHELDKELFGQSYNNIALNADVRKATVSDTFNGKSNPKTATLILMIEAMGYQLTDFAIEYNSINETDITNFINGN